MSERTLPDWKEISRNCVDRSDVEYELEDAYKKGLSAGKIDTLEAIEHLLKNAYQDRYQEGYVKGYDDGFAESWAAESTQSWVNVLEADEEYQKNAEGSQEEKNTD